MYYLIKAPVSGFCIWGGGEEGPVVSNLISGDLEVLGFGACQNSGGKNPFLSLKISPALFLKALRTWVSEYAGSQGLFQKPWPVDIQFLSLHLSGAGEGRAAVAAACAAVRRCCLVWRPLVATSCVCIWFFPQR